MVKVLVYTWTGDFNFTNLRKNILGHTIFPNFEVFRQKGKVLMETWVKLCHILTNRELQKTKNSYFQRFLTRFEARDDENWDLKSRLGVYFCLI